jgi:hypothetical protein
VVRHSCQNPVRHNRIDAAFTCLCEPRKEDRIADLCLGIYCSDDDSMYVRLVKLFSSVYGFTFTNNYNFYFLPPCSEIS